MIQPTTHHRPSASAWRRPLAAMALLSLTTAMLALATPPAQAEVVSGAGCADKDGVTVVVDFTDVGGEIEVGCAEGDPASGREALEAAGFTPADSTPGMICTINALPDPCPEEFDGSYWSYWYAEDDAWTSYQVGADEADPAPGEVDGWRYFDGSAGPQVAPAEAMAAAPAGDGAQNAEESSENAAADKDDAGDVDEEAEGFDPSGLIAAGVVAVVLIAGIVLVLRRRSAMRED
ncbi:MAG TPA: hypothetical protein H9815_21095 [Candidatus Ruania gallistercoris]|uniref:Uncharacterized protein n=1 Tax=Candidatus Ruania gallistercoris TaxID=2838746 RepID=A0A9D2EJA9_9MICO|nr:hypothetical protein [Candidatus Ruania gallistercoris]